MKHVSSSMALMWVAFVTTTGAAWACTLTAVDAGRRTSRKTTRFVAPRLAAGGFVLMAGLVSAQANHTVAFFPSASDAMRQGFARVINHSVDEGAVRIVAVDDSGRRADPVTLAIDPRQTVHFNSDDLELGNEDKGLSSGVGSGEGDWRLELTSDLDIEVLAYIRTTDGFLTAMHDTVPIVGNRHEVGIFNPASNRDQVSRLRLINTGESDAAVTITGVDSTGESPGGAVEASIEAGASRMFTAAELEDGGLGDGAGKWRLRVESDQPVVVVNLLESPTGHLTNLSTTIGTRRIPLFPGASSPRGQGFVRILNRSHEAGEASVAAFDDTGRAYDPVTLSIGAGETAYFNSDDLEQGNSDKGLSGGTGVGEGDWRLEFESELDIEVLAYVRTEDGFLTAIHDAVPGTAYRSRVPTFNPGSNVDQVSRLRLVNVGTFPADVRIQGIDGLGGWSSNVQVSLPPGAARSFTAGQLESGGESFAGMLGDGAGKWQLIIRSDQPVVAMSLLESPTGHLTSLSTIPADRLAKSFNHRQSFSGLRHDLFRSNEAFFHAYPWYRDNYEYAKYVGFQELLKKHDYHLPTGRGLTVLQAESRNHTPDDVGDVYHLFVYMDPDNHSRNVAAILTEQDDYPIHYTRHTTFSSELDSFHATDTADLRAFAGNGNRTHDYPLSTYDGVHIAPAKLLNVSSTNGGSFVDILRHFDKFVEANDLVACTSHSQDSAGNWTTSGMAYNSIVVDKKYGHTVNFDGAKVNDHGSPRYKPDITTRSAFASATSWSSPQACSAAALLLERAKVDPHLSNAYHSIAIKAILMAGATRFNYRVSVEWASVSPVDPLFWHGEWERTSDELPVSPKYGAGALNVLAAYDILDAGEFDGGSGATVGPRGWDYARDRAEGEVLAYPLEVAEASTFSAVLVWHRYIDDDWTSYLPDYELEVLDGGGGRVAFSNTTTSNVELVEATLQPGSYVMQVRVASDGGSTHPLTYGLAWTTKAICADPGGLGIEGDAESWTVEWDESEDVQCRKYRLQVRADAESDEIEADLYLDGNSHTYARPDDASGRYFRVHAYPNDGDVAYRYPSSATRIAGDP